MLDWAAPMRSDRAQTASRLRLVLPILLSMRARACLFAAGLALLEVGGGIPPALAQEQSPVKREILALYDGALEGDADATRIHRFAELPLNYLGFIVRFHDIRAKLPEPADVERYRGVLTWFTGPASNSNDYLAWADRVSRLNVRYVILGDVGIALNSATIPAVNRLLALAGVRHTGEYVSPTLGTRIAQEDPNLVGFECRLGPVLPDYPVLTGNGAGTRIGAMLITPSYDGGRKSVVVAIGEKGGYAALNYEMCHQRAPLYQGQWLINPFDFFRSAFGAKDQPIPDTTTASGNRLYFSVLESDGLTRPSKIESFQDAAAGEVVLRELIEPFHDLPKTFALQGEELAKAGRSGTQTQLLVQRILANRNVDLLGHGLQVTFSRYDSEYPSVSNLSPLISAGPDHFINRPMSDETAYSSHNQSVVGENGFAALKETVRNTDSPRRLKPFFLNYHAYSGEYPALLRSVKNHLSGASATALTPVSANRYAAIVVGFLNARIEHLGGAAWRIRDRGALQTVRFDDVEDREVDYGSSVGVIGSKRNGATLYVALDETVEPAVVALAPPAFIAPSGNVALVESRWLVRAVEKDECGLHLQAHGYGDGSFTWSGASGRYEIAVNRASAEVWRGRAEADDAGNLKFVLPVMGVDPVTVRINCAGTAHSAKQ